MDSLLVACPGTVDPPNRGPSPSAALPQDQRAPVLLTAAGPGTRMFKGFLPGLVMIIACCGCGPADSTQPVDNPAAAASQPKKKGPSAPADEGPYSSLAENAEIKQGLKVVERALDRGAFDEAAAQLFRMRAAGSRFSEADGSAYRTALSETYSLALEASTQGDARGKAAVQMIRAAGPQ